MYTPGMNKSRPEYTSFLVRLWREPPASAGQQANYDEWLAQVEHIPSGEQRYFTSLDDLFAFIQAQIYPCAVENHICRGAS